MGDFNWISPQFLAFASPQSQPVTPIPITSPAYATLPSCIPEIAESRISQPFKNVLTHFVQRSIGLVVRLNSELYCPTYFTALGINHIDMIFEDGTCPPLPLVRKFIKLARDTIKKNKGIAVHCKAGLGRTGCLIGAYLIYRHGFTANEVIAFMRFMRPGMVVGPQQHWLHLNQGQFREWYIEDQWKAKYEATRPATPRKTNTKTPSRLVSNGQAATPPNGSQAARGASRSALGEIDGNDVSNPQPYQDENLPAPTPGQPRKYARTDPRHHPYSRSTSAGNALEKVNSEKPDTEVVTMTAHRQSIDGNESEEEYTLRMLAHRRSQSRSPNGKGRSVSYTTTTTTMRKSYDLVDDIYQDPLGGVENQEMIPVWDDLGAEAERELGRQSQSRPKTPASMKTGSGSGGIGATKVRGTRESPRRSGGEEKMKIRKTSGRVGSASHQPIGVKR
jgi:cell division cycle 14